jgi:phosphoglycolate phosphatase-like HAD superfamily hydrolase
VAAALDRVAALDGVQMALLTGNYEHGARIKLQHFGLWSRFAWGAYGDEHAERDALAVSALALARERGLRLDDARHAVVIGDTPFDVACARAAGARVVAVATGSHSLEDLRACGPDLALEDLRAVDALVQFIARD